jgi:ribosomal protein L27
MGVAKSGDQEVRVGEVFVECAGQTGFPGFGFSGRATTASCGGEDGSRRKKCNSQDQGMAAGGILNRTRDLKWKSRMIVAVSTMTRQCCQEAAE